MLLIPGPVGHLQAQLDSASQPGAELALLCHPHPLYGGSMHDAVLSTLSDVLLARGVDCLRFNFRGVGASEGQFDQGLGEVQDLLAVDAWARAQHPESKIWWLGYSFGAAMVWQGLAHANAERAVLVAPPVGRMDFSGGRGTIRVDVIAGDQDEFIDQTQLRAWDTITLHAVGGADHFFSGAHTQLSETLGSLLK